MTDDAIRSSYCEVRGGVNGSENESSSITCANENDTSGTPSRPCSVSETTCRSDLELGGGALGAPLWYQCIQCLGEETSRGV